MGMETKESIELQELNQLPIRNSVDMSSRLEDIEKALFAAIEEGDSAKSEYILKVIKMNRLQRDFRDEIGRTTYHYVIEGGFESILKGLLDARIPLGDALLRSIARSFHEGTILICNYVITLPPEDRQPLLECRSENSDFHSEMSPLKLAAMRNNFQIVELLIKAGASPLSKPQASKRSSATLTDIVSLLDYYRAVSSEAYLGLAHVDPLENAFQLSRELRELGNDWEEFNTILFSMAEKVERFSASLLDHLSSTIELQTLFKQSRTATRNPIPKVERAIKYLQKDFVGHAHSQKAMSFAFYQVFVSSSSLRLFLMTSLLVVVYPILSVIVLMYQGKYLSMLLRTPHIKLWMSFGSDMFLLILVALHSIREHAGHAHPFTWFHVMILAHCTGLVWKHMQEIFRRGLKKFFLYKMNILEILIVTLCSAFVTCDWIGREKHEAFAYSQWTTELDTETNMTSQCTSWSCANWNHPVIVSNGLCGVVVILCAFRAFHSIVTSYHAIFVIWKSTIGAIRDLVRFSAILGGLIVSVAVGMNAISLSEFYAKPSQCWSDISEEPCTVADERFISLPNSMLTLYLALFTVRGETIQSIDENTVFAHIYYFFFAAFFILAVVIGLNLLVAILAAKLTNVQRNSDIEWKFGRARLWLRFIEPEVDLPPPFNLLPRSGTLLRMIGRCIRRKARSPHEGEETAEDPERAAKAVIHKLLERHQDHKRESMPSFHGFTLEDFRMLKQDFVSLRKNLSRIVRLIEMSIESLQEIVEGLNCGIAKLNKSDIQLDDIDHNRIQIQDDDFVQLTDDVTRLQKIVRRALAHLQSTNLISQMATMYKSGRTVDNDDEARTKLETYRKDFNSYAKNLYA